MNKDRVEAVAGGVTFYGLLSLFPAITVLVSLYGVIADPTSISQHLETLGSLVTEGALAVLYQRGPSRPDVSWRRASARAIDASARAMISGFPVATAFHRKARTTAGWLR